MTTDLSDPHNGGRTVAIVESANGTRVVYKPRSLAADVAFAEFVCWMNAAGATPPLRAPTSTGGPACSRRRRFWSVLAELATHGRFDAIIDPFFDLHAAQTIKLLRPFGTYVTCGFVAPNQHLARTAGRRESTDLGEVLLHAMKFCFMP
jgi:hypothetical protein